MPRIFGIDSGNTARRLIRPLAVDSGNVTRLANRIFVVDSGNVSRLVYQAFAGSTSSYTSHGSFTETIPSGASNVVIEVWGASSAGGDVAGGPAHDGGGGASGGYARSSYSLSPSNWGQTMTVVIGTGGVARFGLSGLVPAVDSSVASGSYSLTTMIGAKPFTGGSPGNNVSAGAGGSGLTGSGGNVANVAGNNGGTSGVGHLPAAGVVGVNGTGQVGGTGGTVALGGGSSTNGFDGLAIFKYT